MANFAKLVENGVGGPEVGVLFWGMIGSCGSSSLLRQPKNPGKSELLACDIRVNRSLFRVK